MDPNAKLAQILRAVKGIQQKAQADIDGHEDYSIDAVDLANDVDELDEWITKGGFLPSRWSKESGSEA